MKLVRLFFSALLLTAVCCVAVSAQDSERDAQSSGQSTQPSRDEKNGTHIPITNSDYTFPTGEQRLRRYVRNMFGPASLAKNAAAAGISQWKHTPEEWGQGAEGYGKRFASNVGSTVIRQSVSYGLSEAFRLDTGFEKSKQKSFWPRLSDALVQNVTSRTQSGKRVFSVPIFAGVYAGSIIPRETWYPSRYGYKDGLRAGTYSIAAGFAINAVREFVFNR